MGAVFVGGIRHILLWHIMIGGGRGGGAVAGRGWGHTRGDGWGGSVWSDMVGGMYSDWGIGRI